MSYPFLSGKKRVASPNLMVRRISSVNLLKAKAALKPANPVRLVTSLKLRRAKAALKPVARPKPKPRVTGYNLRAAMARLRKVKSPPKPAKASSPPKKKVAVPPGLLKTAKFNKLVEKIWKNAGAVSNARFQNAWYSARMKAIKVVENRLRANKPAFSPSPVKLPSPLSPLGPPPKAKPKAPSPPKPKPKFKLSPSSGRAKIQSKNTGRWVYANLNYSMDELKSLATRLSVDVKGLRSKADIAKKLFG
jgi:hypothetical protein